MASYIKDHLSTGCNKCILVHETVRVALVVNLLDKKATRFFCLLAKTSHKYACSLQQVDCIHSNAMMYNSCKTKQ